MSEDKSIYVAKEKDIKTLSLLRYRIAEILRDQPGKDRSIKHVVTLALFELVDEIERLEKELEITKRKLPMGE